MTTLFSVLDPEAKEELIHGDVIELVSVIVTVLPDPDRPDDRLAMKIAAIVYDDFAPGTPGELFAAPVQVPAVPEKFCVTVSGSFSRVFSPASCPRNQDAGTAGASCDPS